MGHRDYTTTLVYADFAPDPAGGAAFAERAFGQPGTCNPRDRVQAHPEEPSASDSRKADPQKAGCPTIALPVLENRI